VLTGARAILPVYKTTQATALYREARLRPPEIELDLITDAFAARTARLDPQHPLINRKTQVLRTKRGNTRFARLLLSLPPTEQVKLLLTPHGPQKRPAQGACERIHAPQGQTKAEAVADFLAFLPSIHPETSRYSLTGQKASLRTEPLATGP
jgi:hypothetical protein